MRLFSIIAALLLCSCAVAPAPRGVDDVIVPQPIIGIRQVSRASGEGTFGSLFIGPYPFTYPMRWRGTGTVILQYPGKPHIIFDGEGEFVVEPLDASSTAAAIQAVLNGDVVIRNAGQRGVLSPVGTIDGRGGPGAVGAPAGPLDPTSDFTTYP